MLGPRHTCNARQNPLVRIAAASADAMIRFAGEFGPTPVARSLGQSPGGGKFGGRSPD
jgi:phage terminase small subunit